jgi:hypothetical protein
MNATKHEEFLEIVKNKQQKQSTNQPKKKKKKPKVVFGKLINQCQIPGKIMMEAYMLF